MSKKIMKKKGGGVGINKPSATPAAAAAGGRTRSKIRKQKYLSLRFEISEKMLKTDAETSKVQQNLFPEDKEGHEDMSFASRFFSAAEDGGATTLTGLLGAAGVSSSSSENHNDASSVKYEYGEELVRTAMRNKERDASEEVKWVSYSEVVERKDEEVSSCRGGGGLVRRNDDKRGGGFLSLKLDYEEIINAWSDKGSLYIPNDSTSQIVPDLRSDDFLFDFDSPPLVHGLGHGLDGSNEELWRVPEMGANTCSVKVKEESGGEEWKMMMMGQREASMQRYKEKRRNRLFSKTIRYEVRKLNAEKRPRIKGRFVKRS